MFEDKIQPQVNLKSSNICARKKMDIVKVSKVSGLPASTLRFYEKKDLSIQTVGMVCVGFLILK